MRPWRKSLLFFTLLLTCSSLASAGIIRHVVCPVAKKAVSVSKAIATKAAHGTKAVVY